METTSKKVAIFLAVLSVGAIIIASLASSTHSGLANAQQSKHTISNQVNGSLVAGAEQQKDGG